jgi:predicted  nucleic acid-binding Zn-ribbon protein
MDEMNRSKRIIDEKQFEAGRLREESIVKGDQVTDLRNNQSKIEHEIETVKVQRAEMWREIAHLKEINDNKALESGHQSDKIKSLNHDLCRISSRIEDTQKLIDLRSHDLRAKQIALEDTERELSRVSE